MIYNYYYLIPCASVKREEIFSQVFEGIKKNEVNVNQKTELFSQELFSKMRSIAPLARRETILITSCIAIGTIFLSGITHIVGLDVGSILGIAACVLIYIVAIKALGFMSPITRTNQEKLQGALLKAIADNTLDKELPKLVAQGLEFEEMKIKGSDYFDYFYNNNLTALKFLLRIQGKEQEEKIISSKFAQASQEEIDAMLTKLELWAPLKYKESLDRELCENPAINITIIMIIIVMANVLARAKDCLSDIHNL